MVIQGQLAVWGHVMIPCLGFPLISVSLTFSSQPLDKVSQRFPHGGVHVHVVTVSNVFLVHNVAMNSLGAKSPLQQLTVALFKLSEV